LVRLVINRSQQPKRKPRQMAGLSLKLKGGF
jgi:hypothetical protein